MKARVVAVAGALGVALVGGVLVAPPAGAAVLIRPVPVVKASATVQVLGTTVSVMKIGGRTARTSTKPIRIKKPGRYKVILDTRWRSIIRTSSTSTVDRTVYNITPDNCFWVYRPNVWPLAIDFRCSGWGSDSVDGSARRGNFVRQTNLDADLFGGQSPGSPIAVDLALGGADQIGPWYTGTARVSVTTVKVSYGPTWDAVKSYRIKVKQKRR